jgi:hypothetical protein
MNHSDSESADEEYESADEGLRGEDIDISELGLDDDDDEKIIETKTKHLESKPTDKILNTEVSSSLETNLSTSNLKSIIETKSNESYIKEDFNKKETIIQDQEKLEDDDEINKLLDEMNIDQALPVVNKIIEDEKPNSSKVKESIGWDDEDLNLDEEELNNSTVAETNIINKNIDDSSSYSLKTEVKENQKQSSWSWSSFGSSLANVASQLGTGLNQVVETLEQSIGAPDPVELALAAKKEREKVDEKFDEIQEKEINNDWNNDDQEWFTINTLTSKVI